MKKLLLLSLLASALSVSGQQIGSNKAQLLAEASSSAYAVADGDTLVIPASIKFIKIDGKVFEILRKVELEPVHVWNIDFGGGTLLRSTMLDTTIRFGAPTTGSIVTYDSTWSPKSKKEPKNKK